MKVGTTSPAMTGISEADLQVLVLEYAALRRWSTYHTFDSRRSAAGFPDVVLVRPPRLLFAELKRENGKVTDEQRDWLIRLGAVPGVETYVWRPSQWSDIEAVLA